MNLGRMNLLFGPGVYKFFGRKKKTKGTTLVLNHKVFKREPERKDIWKGIFRMDYGVTGVTE